MHKVQTLTQREWQPLDQAGDQIDARRCKAQGELPELAAAQEAEAATAREASSQGAEPRRESPSAGQRFVKESTADKVKTCAKARISA